MKIRKRGYWWLFITTLLFVILAVTTVVPSDTATKVSLLGYKAYCAFTPISTILCLFFAGLTCFFRKRFFVSYK